MLAIYTLKFVSIYTHVIIGKPHSGWVDIIYQHFFQFIVTLVLVVQMVVISVISYIAFHINIEQIVDENIKQQRPENRPLGNSAIYSGPITMPAHDFNSMITISQIADNQITRIHGHTVCFKFSNKKSWEYCHKTQAFCQKLLKGPSRLYQRYYRYQEPDANIQSDAK